MSARRHVALTPREDSLTLSEHPATTLNCLPSPMIAVGGLALLQGLDQTPDWPRPARPGAQPDRRRYRARLDRRYAHLRRQRREFDARPACSSPTC
jgi:hypothetical protein